MSPHTGHGSPARPCTRIPSFFSDFRSAACSPLARSSASVSVERIASYEAFYGTFGSVIVIILWFYLSTMTLVIGGFFNAELERHAGAPAPDRSLY